MVECRYGRTDGTAGIRRTVSLRAASGSGCARPERTATPEPCAKVGADAATPVDGPRAGAGRRAGRPPQSACLRGAPGAGGHHADRPAAPVLADPGREVGLPPERRLRRDDPLLPAARSRVELGEARLLRTERPGTRPAAAGRVAGPHLHARGRGRDRQAGGAAPERHPRRRDRGQGRVPGADPRPHRAQAAAADPRPRDRAGDPDLLGRFARAQQPFQSHQPERARDDGLARLADRSQSQPRLSQGGNAGDARAAGESLHEVVARAAGRQPHHRRGRLPARPDLRRELGPRGAVADPELDGNRDLGPRDRPDARDGPSARAVPVVPPVVGSAHRNRRRRLAAALLDRLSAAPRPRRDPDRDAHAQVLPDPRACHLRLHGRDPRGGRAASA